MAPARKTSIGPSSARAKSPSKKKPVTPRPVVVIDGRLVGPTLADPELREHVKKAAASLFPNREAALKYFVKRGVYTPSGKLTKRAGGGVRVNKRQTAQIFTSGRSQAVRLPPAFRFAEAEVFIHREPATGDVVLSRKPPGWQGLLDVLSRHEKDDALIPHAVVDLMATQDLNAVKAWRTHLELTQSEVASRLGITQSAYAKLERGSSLRKSSRERIAEAMGISPGQLDI